MLTIPCISNHKAMGIRDHIPYVITAPTNEDGQQQQQQRAMAKEESVSERARHHNKINCSKGVLRQDMRRYLVNHILPPISCLCKPIEGTSPGIVAEKLGLDSSKYSSAAPANVDEEDTVNFMPTLCLPNKEQFRRVKKLSLTCRSCGWEVDFSGIFHLAKDANS